ncbi:MAG: putative amidophosphoribosyltransferase [Candidatus Saccharibacteria bacterium]|nr:putative amidophosphoribosyltransferase [Candidatus Saccharibacteria bacterium]
MIDELLAFIAPHLCSGCQKLGPSLCDNCKNDIIEKSFSECIVCRQRTLRGVCLDHNLRYQQAWVVGIRQGVLQRSIDEFKFQYKRAHAPYLADLLHRKLPRLPRSAVLVPIPSSPAHVRERGYDHIELITQSLSHLTGLHMVKALGRHNTQTQHSADRSKRLLQAQSAFRVNVKLNPAHIYVIVDDVITTGSTIDQASRLLYVAGARLIFVVALARQPLD